MCAERAVCAGPSKSQKEASVRRAPADGHLVEIVQDDADVALVREYHRLRGVWVHHLGIICHVIRPLAQI